MKTCGRCGSNGPFHKNKSRHDGLSFYCKRCSTEASKHWYVKHKERGQCISCGKAHNGPKVICAVCRRKDQKKRKQNKRAGLCVNCYRKVERGMSQCERCNARKRSKRNTRVSSGLCVSCDNSADTATRCVKHAATQAWRNSILAAARKAHKPITMPLEQFVVWYEVHFRKAAGNCEWCGAAFVRTPLVDHDHVTGVPRALVCNSCNTIEGHCGKFGIERIKRVIAAMEVWALNKGDV